MLTTGLKRKNTMFTLYLKNGETVKVAEEDLESYIKKNRHLIQVQHKKMGKRRLAAVDSTPNVKRQLIWPPATTTGLGETDS